VISIDAFSQAVRDVLRRDLNEPQRECVLHPTHPALMIVAGPGSGKTTVLVLRALRHVLVDGMNPESVMITTFTRKAAGELSSRLLGWGIRLVEHFSAQAQANGQADLLAWLTRLDVNAIRSGTLDSFCQKWLGKTRAVGSPSPITLEEFAANFVYRKRIFAPNYRSGEQVRLDPYLARYTFEGDPPRNQTEAGNVSININNRLIQDLANSAQYAGSGIPEAVQGTLLDQYRAHLQGRQMFDFSLCAERVLNGLRSGALYGNLPPISALLVDEYQDTNPLQEAIYFELVRQSNCAFAVVGDDDQALYRFRGATVELFTNFRARFEEQLGLQSRTVYLSINHRSTPEIIRFFNTFATHDPAFAAARVAGKPPIEEFNRGRNIPVLGMFGDSLDDLAQDLSDFLIDVFQGEGRTIASTNTVLKAQADRGALGDALLLASSVREYKDNNQGGLTERLPALVRQHLETDGLGVFNPRGQDLRDIPRVQQLLGMLMVCLDPTDSVEAGLRLTRDVQRYLPVWRGAAQAFIASNPAPHSPRHSLRTYVDGWRRRRTSTGEAWPNEVPLLDLLYKLIVWIPEFQRDPEHLVYLEAIMRCVVQGSHYSGYGFAILNEAPHDERSRMSVIYDLLSPIATKEIEVDEDLLFAVPRHRLSIMTIHQSKGLEYPLVIVDVGSEFKTNHAKQAFRRFPRSPSPTVLMESALAPFSAAGPLRLTRSDLDRTFDDLMRLYYVAYSRAQFALVLVGLTKSIEYASTIRNVATFWRRDESWSWRRDNPPRRGGAPTRPESMPLELI